MRSTLDPKLDVVFKLLLADERNKRLLLSFLNAVLQPHEPFVDVEVLNPDTPKETVVSKGAILDVLARCRDGRLVNIEMQVTPHQGLRQRAVYYCARSYTDQLRRGQDYFELAPTESIFILNFNELETDRYHSTFCLLELHDHSLFSADLAIHVLELPKLPQTAPDPTDSAVLKWARFFAAKTDEELQQVAMTDPEINEAKQALERLSADPAAQQLARERELAAWNYERTLRLTREEGREEGVRDAVIHLCHAFGIDLTDQRQAVLKQSTLSDLQKLLDAIAINRRWPDS